MAAGNSHLPHATVAGLNPSLSRGGHAQEAPALRPAAVQDNLKFLHYVMLVYLFLYCSRVQEFVPWLRLSAVLLTILLLTTALTLRITALTRIPYSKILIAFVIWVGICVPFSTWPGGSLDFFESSFQALLLVAVIAACIWTREQAVRAMKVFGLAMATASALSFVMGSQKSGRLVLESAGGATLSDPNYYCYYVLTGLPFLLMAVYFSPGMRKIPWLCLMFPVFSVAARSGSRGGMLAFAVGLLFLLWASPGRQKFMIAIAAAAIVIMAGIFLPADLKLRFTTLFDDSNSKDSSGAAESAESRKHLLIRSLELTRDNPVFGVGPGQFMTAESMGAMAQGMKGSWHASHNTYTQFSSEVGIPGGLMFLVMFFGSFFGLNRVRKHGRDLRDRQAALFLQMSILIAAVSITFLSIGYGGLPFILVCLSGVFRSAVASETAVGARQAGI